jgi:hypothetical protein
VRRESRTSTEPVRHAIRSRWQVDEIYLKVAGGWRCVYRAVDEYGHVIDVCVSPHGTAAQPGATAASGYALAPAPRARRAAGARHEAPTVDVSRLTTAGRHKIKRTRAARPSLQDSLSGVTLRNAGGQLAIPSTSRRGGATPGRRDGATFPAWRTGRGRTAPGL